MSNIQPQRETWEITNLTNRTLNMHMPPVPLLKAGQTIDLMRYVSSDFVLASVVFRNYLSLKKISTTGFLHTHDDKSNTNHTHTGLNILTGGERANADSLHTHSNLTTESDVNKLISKKLISEDLIGDDEEINLTGFVRKDESITQLSDIDSTGDLIEEAVSKSHDAAHTLLEHDDDSIVIVSNLITLMDGSNADSLHTHNIINDHDDLTGISGGASGNYYHLTQSQHNTLTDGSNADLLHSHAGAEGDHNSLTGLQGGISGEYYHLTEGENNLVSRLDEDSAGLTFDGVLVGADSLWSRAGTTLSPLNSGDDISLSGNIEFINAASHTITSKVSGAVSYSIDVSTENATNSAGDITFTTGAAQFPGAFSVITGGGDGGGGISLLCGSGALTGAVISITAGISENVAFAGGSASLIAGANTGGGTGGELRLFAGASASGIGGSVNIDAGAGASGTGGDIEIDAGSGGLDGIGGNVNITAGSGGPTATGGDITISGGVGGSSDGDIIFKTSSSTALTIDENQAATFAENVYIDNFITAGYVKNAVTTGLLSSSATIPASDIDSLTNDYILYGDGGGIGQSANLIWDDTSLNVIGNINLDSNSSRLYLGENQESSIYFDGEDLNIGFDNPSVINNILISGDLFPALDRNYNLGSNNNRWNDFYYCGKIYSNNASLEIRDNDIIYIDGDGVEHEMVFKDDFCSTS